SIMVLILWSRRGLFRGSDPANCVSILQVQPDRSNVISAEPSKIVVMMTMAANHYPVETVEQLQHVVATNQAILPHGGRSKPTLSVDGAAAATLDLRSLSGILEYEPGEYTITARAGTPLAEVQAALTENGQYLPFEPPLVDAGATLGGTVAAGLSGSGR